MNRPSRFKASNDSAVFLAWRLSKTHARVPLQRVHLTVRRVEAPHGCVCGANCTRCGDVAARTLNTSGVGETACFTSPCALRVHKMHRPFPVRSLVVSF